MGVYNGVNSFFNENLYFCTHEFLPMTRKKIKKSINKTHQMKIFSEIISPNCALQYTAAEHEHLFGRRDMT